MQYPVSAEVEFNSDRLVTVKTDGVEFVAMKPLVESIGLSWSSQVQKLLKMKDKFNYVDIDMVAGDGRKRSMGCLPLKKLNGWLFSINPEKVKESVRGKLIQYQEECFAVLHDYWTKGIAANPRRMGVMDEINQACADFRHDKSIASMCGKGLNDWKTIKPQHITKINRLVNEAVYLIDMYLADTGKGKLTKT